MIILHGCFMLKCTHMSILLLFTIGGQSVINDAIDEWCKCLQACIYAKGILNI